jgi:hypothetical protein
MGIQVTVSLPNDTCQRAQGWADQSGQTLQDFLAEAIEMSLSPLGGLPPAVDHWSDEQVLATADRLLAPEEDRRLSELLTLQREGTLDSQDRGQLVLLMQQYQEGLVRKAAAIREAVRRGLREPPAP